MNGEAPNDPPPDNQSDEPKLLSLASLQAGLNDWVTLLGNPDATIFKPDPQFTWTRLIRLVIIVLGFTGATLGISLVVLDRQNITGVIFQKAPAGILLGGAVIAVAYTFLARPFGVTIAIRDAFFAILLIGVPWIPLTAVVYVAVGAFPVVVPLLVLWIFLMPLIVIRNICRGVGMIVPECNKWRIRGSVVIPAVLLFLIVACVWLFREPPNTQPLNPNPANRVAN